MFYTESITPILFHRHNSVPLNRIADKIRNQTLYILDCFYFLTENLNTSRQERTGWEDGKSGKEVPSAQSVHLEYR